MSSLALYRRYRPESFAEVIGQEHVTDPLQQALRNNRVNHAYLFSGPRGCGKTTSARILARCLNCEQGPTPTPCGACQSCRDLARNGPGSIDVIEIDAASHGGVDDARDLREKAFFGPAASRYKIYIIDEAHMVTPAGFNALLKVVEEPPEHLKFVFATTEPEKVIGTIRSRTHHYPFRLVPPGTLREYLGEVCRAEGISVEDGVLPLVVRAGAGSVRDSMSVMDQLLAGAGAEGVTYAMATALLGYTDGSLLDSVVEAFASGDGAAAFAVVDRVVEGGDDPRRFVADLLERLRDLVILAAVPDAGDKGLLDVPAEVLESMRAQARSFGAAELSRAADLVNEGLTEMRGATSPRLQLELICARVLLPAAYGDERSVMARLDRLERGGVVPAGGGLPGSGYAAAPASSSGPGDASSDRRAPATVPAGGAVAAARAAVRGSSAEGPGEAAAGGAGSRRSDDRASGAAGGPLGTGAAPTGTDVSDAPSHSGPSSDPAYRVSTPSPGGSGAAAGAPGDTPGGGAGAWPAAASAGGGRRPGGWPTAPGGEGGPTTGARTASGPAPTGDRASGVSPVPPLAGGLDPRALWPDVLDEIKNRRRFTWILLSQNAHVAGFDGTTLGLGFVNAGARDNFLSSGSEDVLRQALAERFHVQWKIEAVVDPSGGSAPPPAGHAEVGAAADHGGGPSVARASAPPPAGSAAPRPASRPSASSVGPAPDPSPAPPVSPEDDIPDEDDPDLDESALSGQELIVRELGATVIEEVAAG
ncbi:DNA polymerase III subunit gamma and tau [Streptomyces sp. WMMC905]|uniref:DNA polymerase III subunit gamma and tau n=1 Tax=Streptomyces sp. WMMC905 TaxID=3404123 RepID=UPI003B942F02